MEHEIQQFLTYMAAERGASANTISAYRNDLAQLRAYFLEQAHSGGDELSPSVPIDRIDTEQLQGYIVHLREQQYAAATVARKVAAVKSLFSYLHGEGLIPDNPAEQLSSPRVGRSLPRTLTIQEVDALLGAAEPLEHARSRSRPGPCWRCSTPPGCVSPSSSRSICRRLNCRGQRASVRCIGKGRRERLIPIHSAAVAALHHYLQEARPKLARGPA